MNLQEDILEILNSIEGLLIVDKNENIVFMCDDLISIGGYKSLSEVTGKKIRDVLGHNNTWKVLAEKSPQREEVYLTEGHIVVSNGLPVKKNGKVIGALEYDLFQSSNEILKFIEKLKSTEGMEHFAPELEKEKTTKYSIDSIIGSSRTTKSLKEEIVLAARSNSNVIITGETGTGKELVAHSIHQLSQRSFFDFVRVNCAAIPGELFESELFGYEEGSFTGAKKGGKKGLAQVADKGSLFLDEIDALPMHMQAKMLRFLQEKEIQKIGGQKTIPVDARIIAATNKDLKELVEKGTFREDLYYRLHVISIEVEPLRNKISDIPELTNNFLDELNNSLGRSVGKHRVKHLDNKALRHLMEYDWPGNVRELKNVLERAMNRCYGETMELSHFQDFINPHDRDLRWEEILEPGSLEEAREKLEKKIIEITLSQEGMTMAKAGEILGISRQMLYKKKKQYGI